MSEISIVGSEVSSARESQIFSGRSSHTNMTSPEILTPSVVQPPDFNTIQTKFDVLTGIVSHLHNGLNDQAEENQLLQNQFDNYNEYTNRKIENLSSQFNTRLSDMSKEFDTKLENQSVEINTKLENNLVNLHETFFPLKASFNDKPSPSSNTDTTYLASSGPTVHEVNNQNKSNNQNLQNPENLITDHVASAFVAIVNSKTQPSTGMFTKPVPVTCPQIDKPINVASSSSISFNNQIIQGMLATPNPTVLMGNQTAHQEVLDNLAYRSFREALQDYDLAWALTQSNIDAIDDALNLALKYEAFHSSHRKPNLRKLAEVSDVNTNYSAPKTHFKGGHSGKGACYYCGEPGHFKRDCKKRMTDNKKFIQQMKSGQYNNNQGFNRPNNQTRS
ncbi:unnamed protein product [Mytilus coruscus]|uniref:CCHC-type domain-containing protein n=1 Tax=Mytilus coruscus TaxID=42192 RepID=A0A6J8A888_MYTCO|nr:unnamed protein product [Mytilus coruscus]